MWTSKIVPSILSSGNARTRTLDSVRPGSWSFSHINEKGEMSPNSDFKELLSLLNEAHVRYLVVGGYAVIEHTEPRYTKDLDIWISPDRENAQRVYTAARTNFSNDSKWRTLKTEELI